MALPPSLFLLLCLLSWSVVCVQGDFVEPLQPNTSLHSLVESQTRLPCHYQAGYGQRVVQVTWYKKLADGSKEQMIMAHFTEGQTELGHYYGRVRFESSIPMQNSALLIPSTQESDEGIYICHVSTFPNGNFERHIELTVWSTDIPPSTEGGYFNQTQCDGSTGQCSCEDKYSNEIFSSKKQGNPNCTWTKVMLTMSESVEVYLGDSAQILCQYSFADANNEPSFVMIQWFVRHARDSSPMRIFYGSGSQQMVDSNTDYSGRIQVTSDQQGTRLTIQKVQLSDEREFFCQVNEVASERKTHLRVFAPPQAPVIKGVSKGISVTNEMPSKVASCETQNGFPKPNITWYRNGMLLMSTPGYVDVSTLVTQEPSGLFSVQSTLEYKVDQEDRDAHFSCEVSFFVPGAIRTVESNTINIAVHFPRLTTTADFPPGTDIPPSTEGGYFNQTQCDGSTGQCSCEDKYSNEIFSSKKQGNPNCTWTKVMLTMSESVEVYLGDSAQILCQYSFADANNEPSFVMIQWFVRHARDSSPMRIFYGSGSQQMVDSNTDYSGRIQVTSDQQGTRLTIQKVQLSDEREFFCQVNEVASETKTHLRVFAPPQAPVIKGVSKEICVTNEMPSKVASCETQNGFPKPNITWYRNGMLLMSTPGYVDVLTLVTQEPSGLFSVQSTLEYKVDQEDRDAHFSCEVSFFVPGAIRTVESNTINIAVHFPRLTTTADFPPAEVGGVIALCLLNLAILCNIVFFVRRNRKKRLGQLEITKEKTLKHIKQNGFAVTMDIHTEKKEVVIPEAANGDKKGDIIRLFLDDEPTTQ